jgi:hypothetical protein
VTTTEPAGHAVATRIVVRRSVLRFIGMLGVTAALTVLFFSMRAVMEIGGSCDSRPGTARLDAPALRRFGLALQLVAIAVGIWAGIEIFEWGSGSEVTITFG